MLQELRTVRRLVELFTPAKDDPARPIPIRKLSDVLTHPPFFRQEKTAARLNVFCDYDGVLTSPWWTRGETEENEMTLAVIAPWIDKFTLWSSRWMVNGTNISNPLFSPFPYLSSGRMDNIEDIIHRGNPDCLVYFRSGPGKILRKASDPIGFIQQALKILERGEWLVAIGSSVIDRARTRQLSNEASKRGVSMVNFKYFDTGHIVL